MASIEMTIGVGGDIADYNALMAWLQAQSPLVTDYKFTQISDIYQTTWTQRLFTHVGLNVSIEIDGNGYILNTTTNGVLVGSTALPYYNVIIHDLTINMTTNSASTGITVYKVTDTGTRYYNNFIYSLVNNVPTNNKNGLMPGNSTTAFFKAYNNLFYNLHTGINWMGGSGSDIPDPNKRYVENNTFFNCGSTTGYAVICDFSHQAWIQYRNLAILRNDGIVGRDVNFADNTCTLTNCGTSDATTFAVLATANPGKIFNCVDGLVAASNFRSLIFGNENFLIPKRYVNGVENSVGIFNSGIAPWTPTVDYAGIAYGLGGFYPMGAYNYPGDLTMSFTADQTSGVSPLEVTFTQDSEGETEGVLWEWDFGDGETSTVMNPTKEFQAGVYEVTLTITDGNGATYTYSVTIYAYENDYSPGGRNVTKSNRIYRFAIPQESKQGVGWSEYEGEDYPNCIGFIGACKIFNEYDEERVIVTDCNTFKHYWLGKEDHWEDGGNQEYGGSQINSDILFRELEASLDATSKLRHSESNANLKPWFKDRRNTGEYGEHGFTNHFNASMYFRTDSKPEDRAVVKYFPRRAQIVSDRHIEDESIQAGLRLTGAPWRLVKIRQFYEEIDTAAAPAEKQMSEKTWMELLSNTVIWVGRSLDLVGVDDGSHTMPWDKGSNQRTTGSFSGTTDGPDGNSRSALVFGATDNITVDEDLPQGDLSIILWLRSPTTPCTIMSTPELTIRLTQADGEWDLTWNDGTNEWDVPINSSLISWTMITIVRRGTTIEVYENNTLQNTRRLLSNIAYSSPVVFYGGSVVGFEPRIINSRLTADAIQWVYNDVIENSGNSTCNMY